MWSSALLPLALSSHSLHGAGMMRAPPQPHLQMRGNLWMSAVAATRAESMAPKSIALQRRHLGEYARGELTPVRLGDEYALVNDSEEIRLGRTAPWDRARVAFYFGLWYALSIVYSVKNKQAHLALALPNLIATAQLLVGALVAALLWIGRLRKPPQLSVAAFRTLLPIGLFHGIGHLTGVYATAAGSVSFVQVVKSAGPVWACLLSGLLLRERVSRRVWMSLVPIVGGVGLASAQELRFVWAAFIASVGSDVALALRNVLSKKSMDRPQAKNMTPANGFYLFTILSCVWCLPIALGLEWTSAVAAWKAAAPTKAAGLSLLGLIAQGGLYFTAYSEVQFKALDQISPITHAVGNTMRRVVIMLVCIAVFGTPVSVLGGIGSAIAIVGSYLYAMAKTAEAQKAKAAKAAKAAAGSTSEEVTSTAGPAEHPLLPLMKLAGQTGLF